MQIALFYMHTLVLAQNSVNNTLHTFICTDFYLKDSKFLRNFHFVQEIYRVHIRALYLGFESCGYFTWFSNLIPSNSFSPHYALGCVKSWHSVLIVHMLAKWTKRKKTWKHMDDWMNECVTVDISSLSPHTRFACVNCHFRNSLSVNTLMYIWTIWHRQLSVVQK